MSRNEQFFLYACAFVYLVTGLSAVLMLDPFMAMFGIEPRSINALFELRGNYAGINLITGLFLSLAAGRARLKVLAYFLLIILNSGYALGRLLSLFLDGIPGPVLFGIWALEIGVAVVAIHFANLHRQKLGKR